MRRTAALIPLFALVVTIANGTARASGGADAKYETGVTRMYADYPSPGIEIAERRPVITASFARLMVPVDPSSVVMTVNGVDVTGLSDVSASYAIYRPARDLKPGLYEVRVTAASSGREKLEPLVWTFKIKGRAEVAKTPPGEVIEKPDDTTGTFAMSADHTTAQFTRGPFFDPSALFRDREGTRFNVDLAFNDVSEGRSLAGAFRRYTMPYFRGAENNMRLFYADDNFTASLGNFHFRLSDLTVAGTQLEGAAMLAHNGNWDFDIFGGRTQDPGVSGRYRQLAGGLGASFNWGHRNVTTLAALNASETNNTGLAALTGTQPARETIFSIRHVYSNGDKFTAEAEAAKNRNRPRGTSEKRDSAQKIKLRGKAGMFTAETELYNIGENFQPVSDTNEKYILNDREGFRVKGEIAPSKIFSAGGEYEQYENGSSKLDTRRGSAFAAIGNGAGTSLTVRADTLASERGIKSESTGAALTVFGAGRPASFNNTRFSASWSKINYEAAGIGSDTDVFIISFAGRIGAGFGYSFGFSNGDGTSSNSLLTGIPSRATDLTAAIDWRLFRKLTWTLGYERLGSSGMNSSSGESRWRTGAEYSVNDTYAVNLGYEGVRYTDRVTPGNGYSQKTVHTGMEMKF